jgi:hypothetical protein
MGERKKNLEARTPKEYAETIQVSSPISKIKTLGGTPNNYTFFVEWAHSKKLNKQLYSYHLIFIFILVWLAKILYKNYTFFWNGLTQKIDQYLVPYCCIYYVRLLHSS